MVLERVVSDIIPAFQQKLLDQVQNTILVERYSCQIEGADIRCWLMRSILFHSKKHAEDMGDVETTIFFACLARKEGVAGSTSIKAFGPQCRKDLEDGDRECPRGYWAWNEWLPLNQDYLLIYRPATKNCQSSIAYLQTNHITTLSKLLLVSLHKLIPRKKRLPVVSASRQEMRMACI